MPSHATPIIATINSANESVSRRLRPHEDSDIFLRAMWLSRSPTTTGVAKQEHRGGLPFRLATRVKVLASFDAVLVSLQLWCHLFLTQSDGQANCGTLCALQSK